MSKRRLRIELVLENSRDPVFVLDSKRRVVFFNRGCTELCGWSKEEVLGQTCLFANESDRQSIAALTGALAPPDEVFTGEPLAVAKFFVHRLTGNHVARYVYFYQLHSDDDDPLILGLIQDLPKGKPAVEPSVMSLIHAELGALRHSLRQRYRLNSIIAKSSAMLRVIEQIHVVQQSMASVAVIGAAGVGKEQIARAIHYEGEHGAKAFVPIDCRHLPAASINEAIERLIGSDWSDMTPISALHPGCVYLQHIECLPRDLQQRLTQFFLTDTGRAFRKQVRMIVSSEQELEESVSSELLLEAFYYQVSAMMIHVPSLRERSDELRLLAQHFLEESNRHGDRQITGIASDVWPIFEEYNWPGNLDELRTVIQEMQAVSTGTLLQAADLPLRLRSGLDAQSMSPVVPRTLEPLEALLTRTANEHIAAALEQSQGNKTVAAKLLGISRTALLGRLNADFTRSQAPPGNARD